MISDTAKRLGATTVTPPTAVPWHQRRFARKVGGMGLTYAIALAGAVLLMIPIAFMVSTSLKTKGQVFSSPPVWFPAVPQWRNYPEALTVKPFGLYFLNTLQIVIPAVVGSVVSSTMVAYAFARLRFPGRDVLFIIVLSTLMLPMEVQLIPVFMIFKELGWLNSFKPMQVWGFFGNPFYIFLMRQFFMSIPRDIEDAARMDGCGPVSLLTRIFIPMAGPAVVSVALFSFMAWWNEFLAPLLYLDSPDKFPLSLGLASFLGDPMRGTDWHLLMAAALVTVLPCILVYFLAQKYFIQGVVVSGVKG
jgi:ABC-type glycerol-3-phosphate transport system permease component